MRAFDLFCGTTLIALGLLKLTAPDPSSGEWPLWYGIAVQLVTVLELVIGGAMSLGRWRIASSIAFFLLATTFIFATTVVQPSASSCGCLGALQVSRLTELAIAGGLMALAGTYMIAAVQRAEASL